MAFINRKKVLTVVNVEKIYVGDKEEQSKEVEITTNGTTTVTPDDGKVLNSVEVTVNVPSTESDVPTVDTLPDSFYGLVAGDKVLLSTDNCIYQVAYVNINRPSDGYEWVKLGVAPSGTLEVTENGTHDVAAYENVNVAVPSDAKEEQSKTVEITENGTTTVTPDEGKVLSGVEVTVNVPIPEIPESDVPTVEELPDDLYGYNVGDKVLLSTDNCIYQVAWVNSDRPNDGLTWVKLGVAPSGSLEVTENGTHDVAAYENVNVAVPTPSLGKATFEIDGNGNFGITADEEGYDGLTEVEIIVNVPSYVKVLDIWPEDLSEYNVGDFIYFPGDNEMCQVRYINEEDPSEGKDLYYMCVPKGEIKITQNGSYDIDGLAYAEVNVPTSGTEEWNAWEDAQEITDSLVTLGSVAGAKYVKFDRLIMQDWEESCIKFEIPEVFPQGYEYFYIGILDEAMVQMPIKIDSNFILYIDNTDGFIGPNGMIQEICYAITPR